MPKIVSEQELKMIADVIDRAPEGVRVSGLRIELLGMLGFQMETRTLQRRLARLVKTGTIRCEGTGKGRVYFPAKKQYSIPEKDLPIYTYIEEETAPYQTESSNHLVLSAEAEDIKRRINAPLSERKIVGYQSSLLENYIPNKTNYLPETTRLELAAMGRVGVSELPAGTYLRQIMDRLLIDLSWNSSRLEGNTYSLLETERLLEGGANGHGKNTEETQMILNHKAAIELLADQADEIGFNRYTICNLHALLSDNLLRNSTACGMVRDRPVGISGTAFRPLNVPQQIEKNFLMLLEKAEAIQDPFETAFFAMVHMPYLQAFEDVNKRVSRLSANIPLVQHNLCPLSFVDVESADYLGGLIGVYELNRIDYLRDVFVWAYTRSCQRYATVRQSLGEPDPFRLQYRNQISDLLRLVVLSAMDKAGAVEAIQSSAAKTIEESNRHRFIEVVETELGSLREGNIARYRLRPSEFDAWKLGWK